jgi:glycine/D-amino acid oxidase-like deaminating enzyme/nitrite reductase/ring-hydroxylating ferredoxin subunit
MAHSTTSVWEYEHPSRSAAPLAGNTRYDVCVVGGGIAGLTTAYLLAREGKSVVVLESKPKLVAGETEYTTAHLAWCIDDRFTHVKSVRGADVAREAAASHRAAIDLIGDIVLQEGILCDFKRVDAFLFPGSDGPDTIDEEAETLRDLGLPFEKVDRVPFPAHATGPALRFPDHGQFHPLKYLSEIAGLVRLHGGVIHTDTVVSKARGGSPCEVETKSGNTVTAGAVVIATNNPFEGGTILHSKVAAYLTYAFAAELPKGTLPYALYWDTEDPYHYVRLQPGDRDDAFDYLIVGGEDHKTGQADDTDERWDRLVNWTKERFPMLGQVRHRWSGQVFETPDGLGLIGLAPWGGDNLYIITGDSGMGMTHSTLGARLVTNLVMGRSDPLAAVYSPSRWMPAALKSLLSENLNMASQFADWLTGGDVSSADQIPRGHGAVVRSGLTKLAVYKDDTGGVHTLSAVCPHMGCIVRWNPGEQTWDCPCHGSRFTCEGKVTHGPATTDLRVAESAKVTAAR